MKKSPYDLKLIAFLETMDTKNMYGFEIIEYLHSKKIKTPSGKKWNSFTHLFLHLARREYFIPYIEGRPHRYSTKKTKTKTKQKQLQREENAKIKERLGQYIRELDISNLCKEEILAKVFLAGFRTSHGNPYTWVVLLAVLEKQGLSLTPKLGSTEHSYEVVEYLKKTKKPKKPSNSQKKIKRFYEKVHKQWQLAVEEGCWNTKQVTDFFNRTNFLTRNGNAWHRWALTLIVEKETQYDWSLAPKPDIHKVERELILKEYEKGRFRNIITFSKHLKLPHTTVMKILKEENITISLREYTPYLEWQDEVLNVFKECLRTHKTSLAMIAEVAVELELTTSFESELTNWKPIGVSKFFEGLDFNKDDFYAELLIERYQKWIQEYTGSNQIQDLVRTLNSEGWAIPMNWDLGKNAGAFSRGRYRPRWTASRVYSALRQNLF